ncbi:MAG: hypothetical protein N3A63_02215 [Bacteroidetes bacterium]|nr:hypothetical protein [Bacteroidota bacterium]
MLRKKTMNLAMFALIIGFSAPLYAQTIRQPIQEEVQRYPKLEIQDLYKFAYQAAMGNAHFVRDSGTIADDVLHQLSRINASPHEPLFIALTTDKRIVRLSLRTAKYYGIPPTAIINAILHTARNVKPSKTLLETFLMDIEKLADDSLLPFSHTAVRTYFQRMKEQQYPPVHHSKTFIETYDPVYYIIDGTLCETLLKSIR